MTWLQFFVLASIFYYNTLEKYLLRCGHWRCSKKVRKSTGVVPREISLHVVCATEDGFPFQYSKQWNCSREHIISRKLKQLQRTVLVSTPDQVCFCDVEQNTTTQVGGALSRQIESCHFCSSNPHVTVLQFACCGTSRFRFRVVASFRLPAHRKTSWSTAQLIVSFFLKTSICPACSF